MIALGIDPGLATMGWAAVQITPDGEHLLALGVLTTKKRGGQGVLVTDDLHRRGQEIARALGGIVERWLPHVVCAESISYPRSAVVSAQIGRAWGVLDALLEHRSLPLISSSPQAVKKACTGRNDTSKADMLDALDERFSGRVRDLLTGIRATTLHEHPVDAVGCVIAALHHDHLRLARAVRREPTAHA